MESTINFFTEDLDFVLIDKDKIEEWILNAISEEEKVPGEINYIFCSDPYLHRMNVEHLDHDTLTDIITFNYVQDEVVNGDIFISIDRVKDNSKKFQCSFAEELRRVMAHGVLHLIGFNDKSELDQEQMRNEENRCLNIYNALK